jgi:hypothetical protein
MKKTLFVVLVLVCSTAGCTAHWPFCLDTRSVAVPVNPSASQPLPSGPITAALVEPANAHRVAEAVWDEMDREQQKDLLPPDAKEGKKR